MTGPSQWQAQVLATSSAADQVTLTLTDPLGAGAAGRPGQYAALRIDGPESPFLLRRMGWISGGGDRVVPGGAFEVVVTARGPAGDRLRQLTRGSRIDVLGALGRPFSLPREPTRCLLVGTGTGFAALLGLGRALAQRRCRVEFLLLSPDAPYGLLQARRIGSATHVVRTEPDATGAAVSDAVAGRLGESGPDLVYSVGLIDRLTPVVRAVGAAGIAQQVAVSLPATCGTGACAGCALPVRGNDGVDRNVRVCAEGPVFNADLVRWDDLRVAWGSSAAARRSDPDES